jgi:RNA polymerase sigma factor FliA
MSNKNLIEENLEFARRMVLKAMTNFAIPRDYYDEILAAAHLGLVEAARNFKPELKVKFTSFAYLRIKGSIIDQMRQCSGIDSRSGWEKFRRYQALYDLYKDAEPSEFSTLEDILSKIANGAVVLTLMEDQDQLTKLATEERQDPSYLAELKQNREILHEIIQDLPENERKVIELAYFEGLNFEEICQHIKNRFGENISKSWICRIHQRTIEKIKLRFMERNLNLNKKKVIEFSKATTSDESELKAFKF